VKQAGVELFRYEDELASIPARVSDGPDTNEVTLTCLTFVEQSLRSLAPDDFGRIMDRPDLVVCDPLTFHAGAVLCTKWDVPLVTAHANVAYNETFNWPAKHRQQLLDDPARGERAIEVETSIVQLMTQHGVDETRMSRGDDLALVFAPRALQPHAESFGDNYVFVGPCTDGSVFDGDWQPADDRPVLFVSLGTLYNERPDHFRRFLDAFGDLDWRVVMTTGGSTVEAGPVPPNFELHSWVPQLSVLRQAKVFLTNGGLGGITSALQQGTPLVIMPEADEQDMHAGQVAELGLGRILRFAEATPEVLRNTVLELAADETTLARVRRMRSLIREAGGTRRAADVLETLLGGR
jgi:MGT family glycosyltransferase